MQLRNASPGVVADLDTAYVLQNSGDPKRYGRALVSWPENPSGCTVTGSIGMIDTAVDVKHPAFQGRQIVQRDFVPKEFDPADLKHGTGVAAILLGQHPKGSIEGYLPQARLFSASVFYGGKGQSTTNTELIVNALDWLGSRFVSVINLSFAGKGDVVLEQVTEISASQNRVLIAAAGNFGPKAKPAFPAAYPHVLAVTAVDSRKVLYKAANTGDYIDFAAPGVDIWTAAPKGKGAFRSGTSFAVASGCLHSFGAWVHIQWRCGAPTSHVHGCRSRSTGTGPALWLWSGASTEVVQLSLPFVCISRMGAIRGNQ